MNIILYTIISIIVNFFVVRHIYSKYDYKYCRMSKCTHYISLLFSLLNLGFIINLFLKNILIYECSTNTIIALLLLNFSIASTLFNIISMNEQKLITNPAVNL